MPRKRLTTLLLAAPILTLALASPVGAAPGHPEPAPVTVKLTDVTFVDAKHIDATVVYNCPAAGANTLAVTIDQEIPKPPPSSYDAGSNAHTNTITCNGTDQTYTFHLKNEGDVNYSSPGGGPALVRMFKGTNPLTATQVANEEFDATW